MMYEELQQRYSSRYLRMRESSTSAELVIYTDTDAVLFRYTQITNTEFPPAVQSRRAR